MQRITQLWKSGTKGKLLIGCGGLLVLALIITIWAYLGVPVALILALAFYISSAFRNGAYSRLPWLRRIPGFGAGNPQHMAIATLVYIIPISFLLYTAIVREQEPLKPPSPAAIPVPTRTISMSPTATPLPAKATPLPSTATPLPPTATPLPPTPTQAPPMVTPLPATATLLPPTATPLLPTPTQAPPTATPRPTVKPTATPVPTSRPAAGLPGLTSGDVKVNLERRGFKCGATSESQGIFSGTCDKTLGTDSYHLEWYGRNLMQLDFIDTTAFVGSGEAAKARATEYLGVIATFHFDAAEEAKAWVIANMPLVGTPGVVKETTIAGVHFKLFGGPGAYVLEMGTLY